VTSEAITALAPRIGTRAACKAAGVPQATWYRRHRASPAPARRAPVPHRDRAQPRALAPAERQAILDALHSPRFADLAPAEAWAILLDEGTYLGSQSTFYRLLRAAGETRERRRQAAHPAAVKPELLAAGPSQCWSWDITKLHGPARWTYYHLYVILGIYSRYAVGWMIAARESAALAGKLIADTCMKQRTGRGQLTIHAGRGSSMTSRPVAFLLADLGITQSHSRPHVSNDNPYSEAQFKTLKYRPYFPARFTSIEHARAHCQDFFPWYNDEHRHSGLGLHTAADVHHGHATAVRATRADTLTAAYRQHPERFVSKPPTPPALPPARPSTRPARKQPPLSKSHLTVPQTG
jgi:putative transposase